MMKASFSLSVGCALAVSTAVVAADERTKPAVQLSAAGSTMPTSSLFDALDKQADVVYLIANSSLVFGVDPHGRSEEVTFVGPVTVPKWPMDGYARRVLPDGRQQIDIELTQSELTGESYVLQGPVVLAEHPDLRSLGTITERPPGNGAAAPHGTSGAGMATPMEDAPADFVVERKVLLTTSKGIMYNETAVPVRGRIDAIPPIKFEGTPTGVNVFRGMELPTPLLDREGNVNGWFYSKSHMAYAVLPNAVSRRFINGVVDIRVGGETERVGLSGPAEIHYLSDVAAGTSGIEVMMLALRGKSRLLGGDVMISETFGDRDHFSRGELRADGERAQAQLRLFVDLVTPSVKASTQRPLELRGELVDHRRPTGRIESGKLSLPLLGGRGHVASTGAATLYDEVDRPLLDVIRMELDIDGA